MDPAAVTQIIQGWFDALNNDPWLMKIKEWWQWIQAMDFDLTWLDNYEMPEHWAIKTLETQTLQQWYERIGLSASAYWTHMMAQPEWAHFQESMQTTKDNLIWALDYYGINDKVAEWSTQLTEARNGGLRHFVEDLIQKVKDYLQLERTRITVWEPSNWEWQFEVYMPWGMRDLEWHGMKGHLFENLGRWRNQLRHYGREIDTWTWWDQYYHYKPMFMGLGFGELFPPFSSHASWLSPQHFMTFDRKFFEYDGACQYVLARDTQNGDFSVMMNYQDRENDGRKLIVQVGDHTFELASEFVVKLDGTQVEMPAIAGDTSVMREGNRVRVHSKRGMIVTCDLVRYHCRLEVSGWYFGKVGGLFGSYDNCPSDDWQSPDHVEMDDAASFADSWTDGASCGVENYAHEHDDFIELSEIHMICSRYFKSIFSPFRPCFGHVEQEEFMHMCLNELSRKENPKEEDMCNVASFFADECDRKGVPIEAPSMCLRCELPNGDRLVMYDSHTMMNQEDIPFKADVVFVVSHRSCNTNFMPKFTQLLTTMKDAMEAEGMTDIHFGLVGYGGMGEYFKPHTYTVNNGHQFGAFDQFGHAVENFPLYDEYCHDHEDGMAALAFASNYHFRPGVRRTIVMVPCEESYEYTYTYSNVYYKLAEKDINLSMLVGHDFAIDKSNPKTEFVFGVDRERVFTRVDHGNVSPAGDESLRPHVHVYKDLFTALTDSMRGSVFDKNFMMTGKAQQEQKFMNVFSSVVAMKSRPYNCQHCECLAPENSREYAQTVCKPCQRGMRFLDQMFYRNFDNYWKRNMFNSNSLL